MSKGQEREIQSAKAKRSDQALVLATEQHLEQGEPSFSKPLENVVQLEMVEQSNRDPGCSESNKQKIGDVATTSKDHLKAGKIEHVDDVRDPKGNSDTNTKPFSEKTSRWGDEIENG